MDGNAIKEMNDRIEENRIISDRRMDRYFTPKNSLFQKQQINAIINTIERYYLYKNKESKNIYQRIRTKPKKSRIQIKE